MRSCGLHLVIAIFVTATAASAQPTLDVGDPEAWEAYPGWLAGSADDFGHEATDGGVAFTVGTPNSGMKWAHSPDAPLGPAPGAVVMRYRATGYDTSATDYVIWLEGGAGGRKTVMPSDLRPDGEWHTLAVDLSAAPFDQAVRTVALAVYAGAEAPATLEVDYIDFAEAIPEGAEVVTRAGPPPQETPIPLLDRADDIQARLDWLSEDAGEGRFNVAVADEAVRFTVDQPGRGMKWSLRLDPPLERAEMRYVTLRYRARSVQPYGDYALWLGSEAGGMPQQSERVINLPDLIDDGRWHTETLQLQEDFPIAEMAFQLRAEAPDALFEISRMVLSTRRPRLAPGDMLEIAGGREGAQLAAGEVRAVDLSAVCNASAERRLAFWRLSEWLDAGRITAEGVPFALADGERDVAVTELGDFDELEVPLAGRAREILLLMFARMPDEYVPGLKNPQPLRWLREPEAIVFDVRYADGSTVTAFPRHVPDGGWRVARQLGVYQLPADPERELAGLTLRESMRSAEFAIAAVTLNVSGEPLLAAPSFRQWQVRQPREAPEARTPSIRQVGDTAQITGGHTTLRFQGAADGTAWLEEIASELFGGEVGGGELLRISADDTTVALPEMLVQDMRFEPLGRGGRPEGWATFAARTLPVEATLRLAFTDADEPLLGLQLRNTGGEPLRVAVDFPAVGPLRLSEDPDDDWYLFPRRGTVLSNRPTGLSAPHGGQHKLQFMDVYSAETGGGVYVMTHDLKGEYGLFELTRTDAGTQMSVRYRWVDLPPGERVLLPDCVIAAHPGDWHEALHRYQRWVHSWYEPTVPRKQWFREVFNFRQHRLRHGLLDFDEMQYQFDEIIQRDREALGCIDYLHIFDWSETEAWGRVGDYDPWEEIPGPEEFRAAVEEAQGDGVPVGLYLEGYLISKRSRVGQEHGAEWTLLNADGEEYGYFSTPESPNWSICPAVDAWQAYMERTFARAARQTHAMGLYIDEFGFGNPGKLCYNEAHEHAVPMPPIRGEREFTRRVRDALPDDRVLYTEEVPDPVTCQYQDGAFCYSAIRATEEQMPAHLELLRFVLPDFKVFQLNFYAARVDGNWNLVKRPFFNGDGWWLQGNPYSAYDELARGYLRKCFALCHEYADCFTSMEPEPLVQTLQPGLFSNRFPGQGRTLWTLYNASYVSMEGPVIAVEHVAGARYFDAWHDRELQPRVEDGVAVLSTRVDPHDLGCVVQITQ